MPDLVLLIIWLLPLRLAAFADRCHARWLTVLAPLAGLAWLGMAGLLLGAFAVSG